MTCGRATRRDQKLPRDFTDEVGVEGAPPATPGSRLRREHSDILATVRASRSGWRRPTRRRLRGLGRRGAHRAHGARRRWQAPPARADPSTRRSTSTSAAATNPARPPFAIKVETAHSRGVALMTDRAVTPKRGRPARPRRGLRGGRDAMRTTVEARGGSGCARRARHADEDTRLSEPRATLRPDAPCLDRLEPVELRGLDERGRAPRRARRDPPDGTTLPASSRPSHGVRSTIAPL